MLKWDKNPSSLLKTIIKNSIAQQKLRSSGMSQEQLAQANAELANTIQTTKVEINPRYGTVDAKSGSLTQGVFGDVIRANSGAQH